MTPDPKILKVPVTEVLPRMVALFNTALVRVLLVSVCVAASVTTTPVVGNTAFELTPVPPALVSKIPLLLTDDVPEPKPLASSGEDILEVFAVAALAAILAASTLRPSVDPLFVA